METNVFPLNSVVDLEWFFSVVSWPLTVVSWPLTVVSWPLSVVSWPLSVVSWPLSVVSWPLPVVSWPLSVVSWPLSVVSWPLYRQHIGSDSSCPLHPPPSPPLRPPTCHTMQRGEILARGGAREETRGQTVNHQPPLPAAVASSSSNSSVLSPAASQALTMYMRCLENGG